MKPDRLAIVMTVLPACILSPASPVIADDAPFNLAATAIGPASQVQLLAAPPGRDAELEGERQAYQTLAEHARTPLDAAQAQLCLANWHLARPAATAATRWLLGLAESADRELLASSGEQAQRHIAHARQLLDEAGQAASDQTPSTQPAMDPKPANTPPPFDEGRLIDLELTLGNLAAVAELLTAAHARAADAEGADDDAEPRAAWSGVARTLAVVREATDPRLAASALTWQAFAWMQAGRTDRALNLLPPVLREPSEKDFGFMSRLLRCRILAQQSQFAAAMGLLTRVRAACPSWFPTSNGSEILARQRLINLIESRIGRRWAVSLREGDEDSPNAEQLEAMLRDRHERLFAPDPGQDTGPLRVFRLEEVIPMVVDPPQVTLPRLPEEIADEPPTATAPTASGPTASGPTTLPRPASSGAPATAPAEDAPETPKPTVTQPAEPIG